MKNDIAKRLRLPKCGNYDEDNLSAGPQPCFSCVEAADEIERLRKIISDLKGPEMCDPNDPCEMCKW